MDLRQALLDRVDGVRTATSIVDSVETSMGVCRPIVQRALYKAMSDGDVRIGPGLVPERWD